jgi:hypothetical protein
MSPEAFGKITDRLDVTLVALVLLFAVLVASFPVRNSDFWQHLATGRLIAHGQYEIGKDPFTFTAADVRWVNHSWLFSLALYLIHGAGQWGGVALIVLKGLAVAALAGMMLAVSRNSGQRWLISGVCTAVALLTMGPRLLLQPVVVSYLFLGLTLLVLRWPQLCPAPANPKAPRSYRCFWLLVPLFALWVNCDQWFFLGPVAAGLWWLGEYLQDSLSTDRKRPRRPDELRTLGYAVLAGVAACLLNPHHVFAFTLPAQLGFGDAKEALKNDEQLKVLFLSPLDGDYWTSSHGLSAPGIAYFVLLGAGVVSFTLSYNTLRWPRVLLFVAFGLLSIYHARAIPFFAVVAGPITALNLLDYLTETFGGEAEPDRHRQYWTLGRAVALAAALALVVCTIPGWTQTRPYDAHHVGWEIIPDASLERTCKQIAEWRDAGLLREDARWFNVSPEVVSYMAWYCPGERGFLDLRLALFDAAAKDYEDAREELAGVYLRKQLIKDRQQNPRPTSGAWKQVFENHKIDYAIIYAYDTNGVRLPLLIQLSEPEEFTLYHLDGHTLVSGWNKQRDKDAEARRRNEQLKLDLDARAFGENAAQAPRKRPERAPARFEWYMSLWQTPPPHQHEVDAAGMYYFYYNQLRLRWQQREGERARRMQQRKIAALPVLFSTGQVALNVLFDRRSPLYDKSFDQQDPGPTPAPLYLALRDLRRSLHANPDDAAAYLELGKLYFELFWQNSVETRASGQGFPHVAVIRLAQGAWALNKAIELNPDLGEAHALLADWYSLGRDPNMNVPDLVDFSLPRGGTTYLDVELRHRRERLRIAREIAARNATETDGAAEGEAADVRKESARAQEESLKREEQALDKLSSEVKSRQNQLEVQAANKSVVERAQIALQLGLADEALKVLSESKNTEELYVGEGTKRYPLGAVLLVKIKFSLGQGDDVRRELLEGKRLDWGLLPEYGVSCHQWFRLLAAAASGDYDEADDALEVMADSGAWLQGADRIAAMQRVAQLRYPATGTNVFGRLNDYAFGQLTAATDFSALRGWLALEAGDTVAARKHFEAVRDRAARRERRLAPSAAVGVTFPAERATYSVAVTRPDGVALRSWQLADYGLFLLNSVAAKGR